MRAVSVFAAAFLVFGFAAADAAAPAPKVHVARTEDLPTPLPLPYDEKADAKTVNANIDAALARARQNGKRVLIDLGGNWCPWCRILSGVMALPEVKPFIAAHYEVVDVYVSPKKGHYNDYNTDVLKRFRTRVAGVPWLIITDANGRVLTSSYEVTDEKHETPQAMVNWLAQWAK